MRKWPFRRGHLLSVVETIEALKRANPVVPREREPALFVCFVCFTPSWNPKDAEQGYCGRCHWWTGDPVLGRIPPSERGDDGES